MNPKYLLVYTKDNAEVKTEFKTLKEISELLDVEIHLIRKINDITEKRLKNVKPHKRHADIYTTYKIYDIKKEFKKI